MSFCLPLAQNTWFWFWGRLIFLEKTVHREFLIKNRTCKNNKCVIFFFVVGPKTMVLVDDDFYAALRIISKLIYSEWKYFLCVFKKLTFSEYSVPQIRSLPWNLGLWPIYFKLYPRCTVSATICKTAVYVYVDQNVLLCFHSICEQMVACQGNIIRC